MGKIFLKIECLNTLFCSKLGDRIMEKEIDGVNNHLTLFMLTMTFGLAKDNYVFAPGKT